MMSKATALGLGLNSFPIGAQNHLAPIVDSYADFLNGRYAKLNPRHFRAIGTTQFGNEIIDETVKQRRRDVAQYQPANPGLG